MGRITKRLPESTRAENRVMKTMRRLSCTRRTMYTATVAAQVHFTHQATRRILKRLHTRGDIEGRKENRHWLWSLPPNEDQRVVEDLVMAKLGLAPEDFEAWPDGRVTIHPGALLTEPQKEHED